MPSNNSKYTQEMREETARFIIESGKSATSMAEEQGIDTNTVCRWVRDYRRAHNMPSYAEAKGIVKKEPKTEGELMYKIKELEKDLNEVVGGGPGEERTVLGAEDHNVMLKDVTPANIVGVPDPHDEQIVGGAVLPLL